ncbi:MAG: outer membrane protein assembly factor BamD [Oxalicibacterium faecigallinarum]|uniref:outer membrane protein assembly factor BamD n=1 Tax=Oxalicibacterium faecigallinarum TaxID=573741 RepID=UPI0028098E99|nr:outer membrane protein assembly factor BamD [Oxalicibacterium faecigallinarum]MDQ7969906.1 outer membrane protein assembly factor BamD [Oxalicibacterium faecigallinarum]
MQKITQKILLVTFAILMAACSSTAEQADETKNWSPSKLYAEGRDELNSGNYEKAIKHFEKLESRYPFGTYAQQAQMEIAYAYYRQGDQPQALAAVERFIKLHPDHVNADYMYYLRGLINFNDRVSIFDVFSRQDPTERDQKAVREAFDAFKLLVERFPDSKYTPDARDRLAYLVNAMAKYDVHVADYYYRRGAYLAAVNRAQSAVKNYPGTPAVEQALYIMVKSYEALNLPELRADAERVLNLNYPNSVYYKGGPKAKEKPWYQIW